ncbi:CapA family protein [Amycolatopsis jejuensis]|uniref:CapA family protein n=1 Tax=Amycolatopsis jejuensis TaxID=330084 RepID=UPI00068EEA90|nr:CapA family protein [Amycolatopsis jejuensis]
MLTGDLLVDRDDPGSAFELVAPVLRRADVLFGNNECVYTTSEVRAPGAGIRVAVPPGNAKSLRDNGFDVLSLANNHTLDAGHEGLVETLRTLGDLGLATCGAGPDLAAATSPALARHGDETVAFLAYTCVFPPGHQAREGVPGVADLNVVVFPESDIEVAQSGALPTLRAIADPRSLDRLAAQVRAARESADHVVISIHGGDGTRPASLYEYERQFAHCAIDAGAAIVAGHHHHLLRGIEHYGGGIVFYGLAHLVFDVPRFGEEVSSSTVDFFAGRNGEYALGPREGYPLLPMHPDARMTMVAVCELTPAGLVRAGFVPCRINPAGQPDPRGTGEEIVEYVRSLIAQAGLPPVRCVVEDVDGLPVVWVQP